MGVQTPILTRYDWKTKEAKGRCRFLDVGNRCFAVTVCLKNVGEPPLFDKKRWLFFG